MGTASTPMECFYHAGPGVSKCRCGWRTSQNLLAMPFTIPGASGCADRRFFFKRRCSGLIIAILNVNATERHLPMSALFSLDDMHMFDVTKMHFALVKHHPGRTQYDGLYTTRRPDTDSWYSVTGVALELLCDVKATTEYFVNVKMSNKLTLNPGGSRWRLRTTKPVL